MNKIEFGDDDIQAAGVAKGCSWMDSFTYIRLKSGEEIELTLEELKALVAQHEEYDS